MFVAALALLAPCAGVAQDWSSFNGNAGHSGYVPLSLDSSTLRSRPDWSVTFGSGNRVAGHVACAGKLILAEHSFFGENNPVLAAYDLGRGAETWRRNLFDLGSVSAVDPPGCDSDSVYLRFETHVNGLTRAFSAAFSLADGSLRWMVENSFGRASEGAPLVVGPAVVFPFEGGLVAHSTQTGAQLWISTPPGAAGSHFWQPTRLLETVLLSNQAIAMVDATNGATLQSIVPPSPPSPCYSPFFHAPVVADTRVVVRCSVFNLVAVDLLTGSLAWQRPMHPADTYWNIGSQVSTDGVRLYQVDDGRVLVLSATTGEEIASLGPLLKSGKELWKGPVIVTDNVVVVGSDTGTVLLDKTTLKVVRRMPWAGQLLYASGMLVIVSPRDDYAYTRTYTAFRIDPMAAKP